MDLSGKKLERRAGIEPASLAWKARVIASIRTPRSMMGLGINELGLISKGIFLPIQDRANDSQIFGTGAPLDGWGADTYVPTTILLSRKKQFFIIKANAYIT